jgi:F-type H+-transporting ATPase subunit b
MAEARTAEYEQRLREARLALFKAQETRRAKASQLRAAAVAEAQKDARQRIDQARAEIEKEKQAAMGSLETDASRLASEIIRTVLEPGLTPASAGGQ